jgi:hypothetical protein
LHRHPYELPAAPVNDWHLDPVLLIQPALERPRAARRQRKRRHPFSGAKREAAPSRSSRFVRSGSHPQRLEHVLRLPPGVEEGAAGWTALPRVAVQGTENAFVVTTRLTPAADDYAASISLRKVMNSLFTR